ncbi:MAG: IS200/IS605 family transposase, partial [Bacteroidota bacterium]|nr:IS200/IS605 family transposase [Bacteroidota bacterium]MDP4203092.1 IS200/IS605 family transposase [Bacteroidota bacterium]
MPNTYTQFNLHVVFSVKGRGNFLSTKIREELFPYIAGIVNNKKHYALAVNGYKDHVHLFFEYNPAFSVSDLIRDVKSASTVWINSRKLVPGKFSWQEGYGGFSYSRSQRDVVIKYIMNQEKHHQGKSFKEEYMKLLADFDIEFKNEY